MRASERIYRGLLRLFLVPSFRLEAEAELLEVFREGRSRVGGVFGLVRFWAVTVADLAATAWQERRERPRREQSVGRSRAGSIAMDVRTTVREAARQPASVVFHAVTLGLGIACALLVLVLVRDVLLRPLPFADPDRLVRLREDADDGGTFWPSWPNIVDWRENATSVEGVAAANVGNVSAVLVGGSALREPVGEVSRGFFATLGVEPAFGRVFTPAENAPGGAPTAVISEELWRGALGARPLDDLALTIDRDVYRVIGVLPAGFRFLGNGGGWLEAAVWLPLERTPPEGGRQSHGYHTIARLRPGFDVPSAKRSLDALAVRLKDEHGEATHADRIRVDGLGVAVYGSARTPLRILLAAAFAVLFVACLNLAAALLARGIARDRELAVRSAIGARRADLVRLQLTHSLVLALPGTVLGVALAWAALGVIRNVAPAAVPRLDQATLDPAAVAMAFALAIGAALVAGAIPALVLGVGDVAGRMRTRVVSDSRSRRRVWDAFVGAQAALTLVLLVSSVMLLRSLLAALAVDIGYDPRDVTIASVSLPESTYAEPARRVAFHDQLLDMLRGSPGVEAAGITNIPPDEVYTWIGRASRPEDETQSMWSGYRVVDPGFFEVLRVPIRSGSLRRGGALVDAQLVDGLFDDESPLGQTVRSSIAGMTLTIGGITGPMRQWDQTTPVGSIYQDYHEQPELLSTSHVLIRGDRARVAVALRETMNTVDPQVPYSLDSLERRVRAGMASRTLMLFVALGFAAVSLVLAAAGIHALVAQSVARRRRESGIRLILGAAPGQIRRRVVGNGLRSAVAGMIIGALGAAAAGRAIQSQLFGIDSLDPISIAGSIAVLAVTALAAAWIPAHRAGRVDPARLLREN